MRDFIEWIIIIFLTVVSCAIISIVLLCMMFGLFPTWHEYKSFDRIISLERWQEVSGSFVLWFGWVSTETVYYAYSEVWENEYSLISFDLHSIDWGKTTILESDYEQPKFQTEKTCADRKFLFITKNIWGQKLQDCSTKRQIIVPTWTIQREFKW